MPTRKLTPLSTLTTRLFSAFKVGMHRSNEWIDVAADRRMVESVKRRHDGPGESPDPATVLMAIQYFRRTGQPDGWRGMKRACFGAAMLDDDGWCLLADDTLRSKLLDLAQGQREARRRIRCFQSLLSSYWTFPLQAADAKARGGWIKLREWLEQSMQIIANDFVRIPAWFQTLVDHRNLLLENPCGRYGPKLLEGDGSEFHTAVAGLGIPLDSWVPEEAVIAQMREACVLTNETFKDLLPDLLKVASGQAGISLSKPLQTRCIAMLVSRYSKVSGTPEHPMLRDAAVTIIGNPWLRRAAWDASVLDERGRPDNAAREMVFGWLKRRLIKDFFELLSEDGAGDSRRLEYWLRFEPFINDMWFALGVNARNNRSEPFSDFLSRARGRLLSLDSAGTTADNNAFVMRIGSHIAMECGENGNALYLYRWEDLPATVSQKLLSGKERVDVSIYQLKNAERITTERPLRHVDSPRSLISWEQKFDVAICPILGYQPEERPAFVPQLEELLRTHQISGEDKRPKGGALWIYADNSSVAFNAVMRSLDFSYRSKRGWFKE